MRPHYVLLIFLFGILTGCTSSTGSTGQSNSADEASPSLLSYGMVKKYVEIGKTTQSDVVKLFGAANNMTIDSTGKELWIYDHFYSESQVDSASSGGGVGLIGGGAVAGASRSNTSSQRRSSTRTLTVIIEFGEDGVVTDYSARSGGY